MIIRGVEIVGDDSGRSDIHLTGAHITGVGAAAAGGSSVFDGAIAFPGLINSHDHLEFDLYPPLGHGPYADYLAWGEDIHRRDRAQIASIEAVPRPYRARWGAVKNLLAGVTSVAHHGGPVGAQPIGLLGGTTIHSVRLEARWRRRLNSPFNRPPYVVHIGEGTSPACRREIDDLLAWNLWGRDLVGVHAIAMNVRQARRFRALVWCPLSNAFLYQRSADIGKLKEHTTILLGTDSTLTADWNLWNHLRGARACGLLSDRELFDAVTRSAAAVWNRPDLGRIAVGAAADLVVARKKSADRWEAFFALDPEDLLLVVRGGVPLLIDQSIAAAAGAEGEGALRPPNGFVVRVGRGHKIVAEDAPALLRQIRGRGLRSNLDFEAA
jgi:cytosine/adenosine deaminase-related metal-dependent hydrolase